MTTLEDDLRTALRARARALPVPQQPALDRAGAEARRRPGQRWLIAAACVALIVAGVVALAQRRTDDPGPASPADSVPSDATTTLAKGEGVQLARLDATLTLDVDAEERGGEVSGQFGIGNVVVTIECAGTRRDAGAQSNRRDLILGGEVTDNPDGLVNPFAVEAGGVDAVDLAVGQRVALIIREREGEQSVTLYHPALWYGGGASAYAGSCRVLVGSVPGNLDGGFFHDVLGNGIELG